MQKGRVQAFYVKSAVRGNCTGFYMFFYLAICVAKTFLFNNSPVNKLSETRCKKRKH